MKVIIIILFIIYIFLNIFLDLAYKALITTTNNSNFDILILSVAKL